MKKNCNRSHHQHRAALYTFARISDFNAQKNFKARMSRLMQSLYSKKEEVNDGQTEGE